MSTYKVPVWTIGERMAKARKDVDLSQEEMAVLLSTPTRPVKKQTVSNWENDVNQPRQFRRLLDRWADITGVSVMWLLGLDETYAGDSATRVSREGAGQLVGAAA